MQDIVAGILSGDIAPEDGAVEDAILQQAVAVPWLDVV